MRTIGSLSVSSGRCSIRAAKSATRSASALDEVVDASCEGVEATVVSATGVLRITQVSAYMYGTHDIADEASGTSYALESDGAVDLDAYDGRRVEVYGEPVAGYEAGKVDGGPALLRVVRVEER